MTSFGSNTVEAFLRNSDASNVSVVLTRVTCNGPWPHTAYKTALFEDCKSL